MEDPTSAAATISQAAGELVELAEKANQPFLAHLIRLVALEAEKCIQAQKPVYGKHANSLANSRETRGRKD